MTKTLYTNTPVIELSTNNFNQSTGELYTPEMLTLYKGGNKIPALNTKEKKKLHSVAKKFNNKYKFMIVYADWCGHCSTMVDDISFLAKELPKHNIQVGVINYDYNKELSTQTLGVTSFPTIFIGKKDGELILQNDINSDEQRSIPALLDRLRRFQESN